MNQVSDEKKIVRKMLDVNILFDLQYIIPSILLIKTQFMFAGYAFTILASLRLCYWIYQRIKLMG